MCACVCVCVYVCVRVCVCVCVCVWVCARVHMHMYKEMHVRVHVHTYDWVEGSVHRVLDRYLVLCTHDPQLGRVLKWMHFEAQLVEETSKSLWRDGTVKYTLRSLLIAGI